MTRANLYAYKWDGLINVSLPQTAVRRRTVKVASQKCVTTSAGDKLGPSRRRRSGSHEASAIAYQADKWQSLAKQFVSRLRAEKKKHRNLNLE